MILALKTAGDSTEIILLDGQGNQAGRKDWQSGRRLAEGLLKEVESMLSEHQVSLRDLTGLIAYRGPGSFTGLRIGLSTVNALAYALEVPCVGSDGEDWVKDGFKELSGQEKPRIITPIYDRGPNITKPKR